MGDQAGQRTAIMSNPVVSRQRRFDESWVELASQPSSSSLSSIGDEIVTTGLRVGGGGSQQHVPPRHQQHRRTSLFSRSLPHQQTALHATSTSSQDEYDESESEDDRVLSSSTENASHPEEGEEAVVDYDSDSDDGDNATALGRATDQKPTFRPHPNLFSHPPAHLAQRSHSTNSVPPTHPHREFTRPSFSQRAQTGRSQRGGPSFMSSSIREDNDAALRASLTTLLSCAAAARGLPKSKEEAEARQAANLGVGPSDQPLGLRLVPESELMRERSTAPPPRPRAAHARAGGAGAGAVPSTRSPPRSGTSSPKPKRHSSSTLSSAGRQPGTGKKKKTSAGAATATAVLQDEAYYISPTLLTWVVSAGVVVLVSVVGFGAGYVIGREVGRQEGLSVSAGSLNDTSSAGRDVVRSSTGTLRRFKWGAVGKTIVAAA